MRRPLTASLTGALIGCLSLALTAAPALAQDRPPIDVKDRKVRLVPQPGGWTIKELFEDIHKATGRSILYEGNNATIKNTKVEFVGEHTIDEDRLFEWLQAVLAYHKLVLVPVGPRSEDGGQQWFCMEQANPNLTSRPVYIDEEEIDKYADRDGLYVVTSLQLRHIDDTSRVRNALSNLSTKTAGIGRVMDIQGSRALIVGDFAPIVAAMKRLLSYIDRDSGITTPKMEVLKLQYAVASEIEPIISELIQQAPRTGARNQRGQTTATRVQPKLIADPRLQALIVYATDTDRQTIRDLVEQLDVPAEGGGTLHFRMLKHTDAADMADLLEDLISGVSGSSTSSGTRRPTTGGSRNRTNQPRNASGTALGGTLTEGDPVILADSRTNSLIISASRTQFEAIDELVEKLDRSRPQVLIETSLLELSTSDELTLGVELFHADSNIAIDTDGDGVRDTISRDTNKFSGTSFGLSETIFTDVNGTMVPTGRTPLIGTGVTAGIFNNGQMAGIVSALQTSGRSKILTMPSVVTNDNEQATITVRRTTAYRETIRDDTGQNRDSFRETEATTELTISPHISSDNYLRLDLDQSVESFGNRPAPDAPPDTISRIVDTQVTVPDGNTVVLGGLIQTQDSSSVSKVPFLGDIPLIGWLFRTSTDSSNPQSLFLFVTPTILRDMDTFEDYHRLTWERKLLADDLFGSEVTFPGRKFRGPDARDMSARDKVKRLEETHELDAPRLKAPRTQDELEKEARKAYDEKRREAADEDGDAGDDDDGDADDEGTHEDGGDE